MINHDNHHNENITHCPHCHGRIGEGDDCYICTPEDDPDDFHDREISPLGEYLFDLGATLARVGGERLV
jgi:hypothetical protein